MPDTRETSSDLPRTVEAVVNAIQQPSRDRTEQYAARLDAHLATLPDDASRRRFCEAQAQHWISLYEQWARAVDSGRLKVEPGDPTAFDYTLTIAAIGQRKAKFAKVRA